jgi:hypothetical protein
MYIAMAKAKQQAKRKGNWRGPKTPPRQVEKIPIIGSSCTWRDEELDHLKVKVLTDVDVRELIPEKFWRFDHLEYYEECIHPPSVFLIVGKDELCALSEEDLKSREVVNRILNPSQTIFQSLQQVMLLQPEVRKLNLSRKRKLVSQSQLQSSLVLNLPKSNQKLPGN